MNAASQPPPQPPRPSGPSSPQPSPRPKGDSGAWSVAALAEAWECSRQHIYNLIAAGELAVFDIGTRRKPKTRISDASQRDYVRRHERRAPRAVA